MPRRLVLTGFPFSRGGGATFDERSVPLGEGGLQEVSGVTHNLAWVVDPEPGVAKEAIVLACQTIEPTNYLGHEAN
jgi:hypothetical protein